MDEFLALRLVSLSYRLALLLHTYGFLAVFGVGVALHRIARYCSSNRPPQIRASLKRMGLDKPANILARMLTAQLRQAAVGDDRT